MPRPSKVDRLPAEIRDAIGSLRRDGRTIDEILDHLQTLGLGKAAPERSALGEHLKKWDALAKRLNGSRAAAEAIMDRLEVAGADNRVARLNIEALHASIMELMNAEDGEPVQLSPMEAMRISSALKNLASASRSDQSRYLEMKRELEAEKAKAERVKQAAEAAVKQAEDSGAVDALALLKKIRADIYGIYD